MSNVQDTSRLAYHQIQFLGEKRQRVYDRLREATVQGLDMTDLELSNSLHEPINQVTPRRNELVNEGLVVRAGKRRNYETNRWAIAWKVRT